MKTRQELLDEYVGLLVRNGLPEGAISEVLIRHAEARDDAALRHISMANMLRSKAETIGRRSEP